MPATARHQGTTRPSGVPSSVRYVPAGPACGTSWTTGSTGVPGWRGSARARRLARVTRVAVGARRNGRRAPSEPCRRRHVRLAGTGGFPHGQRRTAGCLVATVATRAGMPVMPEQEREATLGRIRAFPASRPETADAEFTLPMPTGVLRVRRLLWNRSAGPARTFAGSQRLEEPHRGAGSPIRAGQPPSFRPSPSPAGANSGTPLGWVRRLRSSRLTRGAVVRRRSGEPRRSRRRLCAGRRRGSRRRCRFRPRSPRVAGPCVGSWRSARSGRCSSTARSAGTRW